MFLFFFCSGRGRGRREERGGLVFLPSPGGGFQESEGPGGCLRRIGEFLGGGWGLTIFFRPRILHQEEVLATYHGGKEINYLTLTPDLGSRPPLRAVSRALRARETPLRGGWDPNESRRTLLGNCVCFADGNLSQLLRNLY